MTKVLAPFTSIDDKSSGDYKPSIKKYGIRYLLIVVSPRFPSTASNLLHRDGNDRDDLSLLGSLKSP